jgi:L-threonylcarbamoyladenylate synthase
MITRRASHQDIEDALQALRTGDVVAFPTETVYGLGADAQDAEAVRRIFELKGRPLTHPLIVHLDQARYLHRWVSEIPAAAERLVQAFWPGPLTLVLPRAKNVLDLVTGGQPTVAVRVPSHPLAQQLLHAFGGGIAAPSANRYGRVSATRPEHVREEFGDAVRIVLDGGDSKIGLESTIVDCSGAAPQLLRLGSITLSQLRKIVPDLVAGAAADSPRVPGSSSSHYAPVTPLEIVPAGAIEYVAGKQSAAGQRIAVLAMRQPLRAYECVTWVNAGSRQEAYAHDLYANLRSLDAAGCARILVQEVPATENWDAVRDRLVRAAAGVTVTDAGDLGDALSAGVLP